MDFKITCKSGLFQITFEVDFQSSCEVITCGVDFQITCEVDFQITFEVEFSVTCEAPSP